MKHCIKSLLPAALIATRANQCHLNPYRVADENRNGGAVLLIGPELAVSVECLLGEGERRIRATIVGVRNGMFEVCSPAPLEPRSQLTLRHPDRVIESRVVYCEQQDYGVFRIGVLMAADAERRSQVRKPVDLPATLCVAGSPDRIPVRIIDVSDSGLGMEMSAAVPIGASVQVEMEAGTAMGEVRHCAKRADAYRAGMRIQEFVLPPNRERLIALDGTGDKAVHSLTRSVQERQLRYEAILYSLASPLKARAAGYA